MLEEIKSTGSTGQNLGSNVPEVGGSTSTSSTHPMDEVFCVNRLLQIEDLDWTRQLKQAVSNFAYNSNPCLLFANYVILMIILCH